MSVGSCFGPHCLLDLLQCVLFLTTLLIFQPNIFEVTVTEPYTFAVWFKFQIGTTLQIQHMV